MVIITEQADVNSKVIQKGKVHSINLSQLKGSKKGPVYKAIFIENYGIKNDAHAEYNSLRQVSLLAIESIKKQCYKSNDINVKLKPGDFAENITTSGVDLINIKLGDRIKLGEEVILELSKIGKDCHKHCEVYHRTGDCIMPREGVFAKVIKGGLVNINCNIEVIRNV